MTKRRRVPRGSSTVERIEFHIRRDSTGCWLWTGVLGVDGYARVSVGGRLRSAHRTSYEVHVGPIPEGLQIDHLCRVRHCVNPEHLEPVTAQTNTRRGQTIAAKHAATTHCPQGHEYTPENTYSSKRGERDCRQCRRVHSREWARKKARERAGIRG
jgi:hypothetical protein